MRYAKTAKGREEVQKRTYGLSPKLRAVLILVDGHSTLRQGPSGLDVRAALADLEANGFIASAEPAAAPATAPRVAPDLARGAHAPAVASGPALSTPALGKPAIEPAAASTINLLRTAPPRPESAEPQRRSSGDPLGSARDVAVRMLHQAIGPDANNFAPRLASCSTPADLLAQAVIYSVVIGTVRDKDLGDRYLKSVRDALA